MLLFFCGSLCFLGGALRKKNYTENRREKSQESHRVTKERSPDIFSNCDNKFSINNIIEKKRDRFCPSLLFIISLHFLIFSYPFFVNSSWLITPPILLTIYFFYPPSLQRTFYLISGMRGYQFFISLYIQPYH